jgi:HK97 family phage portal protein
MAFDLFKRFRSAPMTVTKSVTLPELLMTMSRTAPQFQKWDTEVAIEQGLKASAIFYACVNRRAQSVGQIPWVAKKKQRDGTMVEAPESPLQKLIDNPNPDFAWAEMTELLSQHIDLAGNSYWSIIRAGNANQPVELWPVLPQGIKIQAGKTRLVDFYRYQYGGITRDIQSEEMVHVKTVNPNDFLYGIPTIQAAGRAVDVDREASQWQLNSMHNRGISDYAIVIDPETTAEQMSRLRELHKEKQASSNNARAPFFTTRDIKTLNQSAVELDFVNSRLKVWEEICSAMGVPPVMVGIMENATLANIETARKIFWADTITPLLRMIRSQLNAQLASQFGPEWYIDYDLGGVEALREDYSKKLDEAKKLFDMGVPFNTISELLKLGVEPIEGGDIGYLQGGLLPAGFTAAQDNLQLSGLSPELLKALAYGKE